jgi:hypothetical protein
VLLACRQRLSSGTLLISGLVKAGMAWKRALWKRWKQVPACTRPARPRRCTADAADTRVVTSELAAQPGVWENKMK